MSCYDVGACVQYEIGTGEDIGLDIFLLADDTDARQKLTEVERLYEIIVGSGVRAEDAVFDAVPGGQEENRDGVTLASDGTEGLRRPSSAS